MSKFYVYTHSRPDGRVFYVGKGKGSRAQVFHSRNAYHTNIVSMYGRENIIVTIVIENLTEDEAFQEEKALILLFGKRTLSNLTDGGEGVCGHVVSDAHKKSVSDATKKRFQNAAYRQARLSALKDQINDPVKLKRRGDAISASKSTLESRKRNSDAVKLVMRAPGVKETKSKVFKALWHSEEFRLKRKESHDAKWNDPEFRKTQIAKMVKGRQTPEVLASHAEKMRLKHADPEYKEKIRAILKKAKNTPEAKLKASIASKKMWESRKSK